MISILSIKKKVLIALSLVWRVSRGVHYFFTVCYPTVRSIGGCLSQRFSKNNFVDPKCPICRLTSCNCGIVLVTILLSLNLIFLVGSVVNFQERIKNSIMENINSQSIGRVQKLMKLIVSILRFLKNISVHIFWHLITGIMLLSLIIVSFGAFLTILLTDLGQTIKCKLQSGPSKTKIG